MNTSTKTFNKFNTNVVKGVAIIFLMIHHCFLTPARYKNLEVIFAPFTQEQITYISSFLKICVGMFVFISAYGITISIKKKHNTLSPNKSDLCKYIKHRYINLFSGWVFVFLCCVLFSALYSGLPFQTYGKNINGLIYFIIDGLGLADLFGTPTLVSTWWYMSLAITLIIVIPIYMKIYNKLGFIYCSLIFVILVRQLNLIDSSLIHWSPAVLIGVFCADNQVFEKLNDFIITPNKLKDKIVKNLGVKCLYILNKSIKLFLGLLLICALIVFRQSGMSAILFEIKDGVIPFVIIWFIYEFICGIKYVNSILSFLGKHSMNIFLVHTLIRATYFRKFIYGFKYAPLIVIVLLIISLVISILIEHFKKISGYNKLFDKINS